jgi:hypothetical protein
LPSNRGSFVPQTGTDKSLPTLAAELWDLVRGYAKQEAVGPLKGIGRFLAFGAAGSVTLGTGIVLLVIAGLRALQTETGSAFDGNWSFVPYLAVLVACAVVVVLALSKTKSTKPKNEKKDA